MPDEMIHDRGRGPEIVGTRITVYNLLPYFLDPTMTEAQLCRLYELTAEQVAAARAYAFNNPDTMLARHMRIEERMAARNSPEAAEQARRTHETFQSFKRWLAERKKADPVDEAAGNGAGRGPTFREWLAERERTEA